jgi:hypothetical protein
MGGLELARREPMTEDTSLPLYEVAAETTRAISQYAVWTSRELHIRAASEKAAVSAAKSEWIVMRGLRVRNVKATLLEGE